MSIATDIEDELPVNNRRPLARIIPANLSRPQNQGDAAWKHLLDILPCLVCRHSFAGVRELQPRLRMATRLIAWLHRADELVEPLSHSASSSCSWAQCVLAKLEQPPGCQSVVLDMSSDRLVQRLALLDELGEVWKGMSGELAPQSRARFASAVGQHLQAVGLLNRLAAGGALMAPLGVSEYMPICRRSSGALLGMELLRYMLALDGGDDYDYDYDGPAHLMQHPIVGELRDLAADYMCMCNDMAAASAPPHQHRSSQLTTSTATNSSTSAHYDEASSISTSSSSSCCCCCCSSSSSGGSSSCMSLPYILYRTGSVTSFAAAVARVADMMQRIDNRCVQLVARIRREHATALLQPRVRAYLAVLAGSLSAALSWSLSEAARRSMQTLNPKP